MEKTPIECERCNGTKDLIENPKGFPHPVILCENCLDELAVRNEQLHEGHFLDSEKFLPNPNVQRLYNKSFMSPRGEN